MSGKGQRGGLGEEGVIVYMFTFKSRHTKMKYVHQSLSRQILDEQEDYLPERLNVDNYSAKQHDNRLWERRNSCYSRRSDTT